MTETTIRAALISTDAAFRDTVRDVVPGPDIGVTLGIEITAPFAQVGEQELQALRHSEPDLIILDLEDDPQLGVKFAQFIAETRPCRFLMVGPNLSPELLLETMRAGAVDNSRLATLMHAIDNARPATAKNSHDSVRSSGSSAIRYPTCENTIALRPRLASGCSSSMSPASRRSSSRACSSETPGFRRAKISSGRAVRSISAFVAAPDAARIIMRGTYSAG